MILEVKLMSKENSLEEISSELSDEIDVLSDSLQKLEKDMQNMQTGNWNGEMAYQTVQKCLEQIDYNKNLVDELKKCSTYLESLKN